MGLLDCVASPEGEENFDKNQKPFPRPPREISQSDHDISRRRGLPLFSSQASLKNIRDVNFWRTRVLRFLFSAEGREDVRILRLPLKQLGYPSVTDFIAEIPPDLFYEFMNEPPPDEGVYKDDKVFWVHDGIAEPGIFKWQGVIENVPIIGLQLDRKKAVPFGIHDGKGLFYCKPGHRALVQQQEVIPYKKFLRSFLGLPPRQDSLIGMRDSVRCSARALAAKNSKPGDRVYLPKEKKYAIVQWIGKIDGETVVDLIYEPPKPEAGKPVSPDEPCISRSMSLADFIGELASEPSSPVTNQQEQQEELKTSTQNEANSNSPELDLPPLPTSPPPVSSDESLHSEHGASSSSDEDTDKEETDESETDQSMSDNTEGESDYEALVNNVPNEESREETPASVIEDLSSPRIPSPKRKGIFGFVQNKRQKRPKSPLTLADEQKGEFTSLPELKNTTPRSRNSNLFGSLKFKKKKFIKNETSPKSEMVKSPPSSPKKKSGLSSSLGALFKSRSKTQIEKLDDVERNSMVECTTPIDDMIPPDKIPTPPPSQEQPIEDYNERRIDRPEILGTTTVSSEKTNDVEHVNLRRIPKNEKEKGEVSLCPEDAVSSESETSDDGEEESEMHCVTTVEMHKPPQQESNVTEEAKPEEIKRTTHTEEEDLVVHGISAHNNKGVDDTEPQENHPRNSNDENDCHQKSSLERFKESKIRNRPTSFGSFLARIKNRKSTVNEEPPSSVPLSPPQTSENKTESKSEGDESKVSQQNYDEKSSDSISEKVENKDSQQVVVEINRSLVKPKIGVQSVDENEGNQEEIVLELLEVKDQNSVNSPPPIPTTEPPKRKPSRNRSFTFSFSGKRKHSQPETPTAPIPVEARQQQFSDEERNDRDDNEPIEQHLDESFKTTEGEQMERKQRTSSLSSSFKRTFSLTRPKKVSSINDNDSGSPNNITSKNQISKPRPQTLYIDNNEIVQSRESFRNKRPASLVVDIKPWSMRHGKSGIDVYSSPSSDEAPTSPLKSPNPALQPKQSETEIPKHRIFTTPSFFYRKPSTKKSDHEPLIQKKSKENSNKVWNSNDSHNKPHSPNSPGMSPSSEQSPSLPQNTPLECPVSPMQGPGGKLKSALKQRKEIESIPKGLKVNDRVIWYSGRGPIPGTVLRLFKDGTDKYTAMVKFDREVKDEPLRLTREGDAYIVTVEELITPDMFGPTSTNQNETEKINEPVTPVTPSVRFDGIVDEDHVPEVIVTNSDIPEQDEHDLPPPFQQEEVTMACGFRRGIQCRDKSCCLETILFSMFYTTNAFDITTLYPNTQNEDSLTRKVRNILRKEIVDPLRREGFCPWYAIKKLRDAVKPLSDEWQTLSTDAEVMMFILFDRALKLQKFISYSNEMSDFLHQLVVDTKDLSKSTTIQHLFETSLQMMDKLKLKTVPTPALILEMPRSNDKLIQYKAVIPNLSLTVSHILDGGPRLCICGAVAKYECSTCTANVGDMSIVFCDNCKTTADVIHFQLTHEAKLFPLNQHIVILDLSAIICVKGGHYFSFVKCGQDQLSPWVFFDGAELENPKVCIEQNLSMWLDRLEKYPGRYQDALQYPLLTHILQDSHICIYQPREKSSSV